MERENSRANLGGGEISEVASQTLPRARFFATRSFASLRMTVSEGFTITDINS